VLIALLFVLSMFAMFSVVTRGSVSQIERHAPYGFDATLSDRSVSVFLGQAGHPLDRELMLVERDPIHLYFDSTPSSVAFSNLQLMSAQEKKAHLLQAIEAEQVVQQTLVTQIDQLQNETSAQKPRAAFNDQKYQELIVARPTTYDLVVQDLQSKHVLKALWKWTFSSDDAAPEQMDWPAESFRDAAVARKYQLVVFVEPGNPRQQREAYFRLMAVRSEAIRRGGDPSGLPVRMLPDPDARRVANPHATVFLVLSQGKQ
jgi:hypothetical protein